VTNDSGRKTLPGWPLSTVEFPVISQTLRATPTHAALSDVNKVSIIKTKAETMASRPRPKLDTLKAKAMVRGVARNSFWVGIIFLLHDTTVLY